MSEAATGGAVLTPSDPSEPYDVRLLQFVEKFALLLHESGMPRMPARVFAYVLADDAEIYTAGELAAGLQVSAAAISTAVRHLVQTGLLARERQPGARTDHYRVYDDDVWSAITLQRDPLLKRHEDFLAEGLELLDPNRPGGQRVRETLEFYRFLRTEMPPLVERWKSHRQRHRLGPEHHPDNSPITK